MFYNIPCPQRVLGSEKSIYPFIMHMIE